TWMFATRQGGAFKPRDNQMYGAVYRAHKEEIDGNKEKFYAEIKGERTRPGKFCLSQPRMREMIVEMAVGNLKTKSGERNFMASTEASDGAGWCECKACVAMG